MRTVLRWARRRWRALLLTLLILFALLNVVAYRHAHAMTHLVAGATAAQPGPLEMTFWEKLGALFGGVRVPRPLNHCDPSAVGLPFEVHTVAGRCGKLEAWHVPHPRPAGVVLLFHGYVGCKAVLLPVARAFHHLGYACFLVDFPGSGGSEGDVTTIGHSEADDVARSVEYVQQTWPGQPVVLYGTSMGSVAILRALAVHGVRADAAVLECPFDRMLSAVENRFDLMGLPSFPAAHLMVFWGGMQHGFDGFAHNPVTYAAQTTCPVLLLQGDQDVHVSVAQAEEVFANLAGEKQLHVFAGAGHEVYVCHREGEWMEHVGPFLKGRGQ
jgi:alpha-beta hydrolase superfamily lysophospholipase